MAMLCLREVPRSVNRGPPKMRTGCVDVNVVYVHGSELGGYVSRGRVYTCQVVQLVSSTRVKCQLVDVCLPRLWCGILGVRENVGSFLATPTPTHHSLFLFLYSLFL